MLSPVDPRFADYMAVLSAGDYLSRARRHCWAIALSGILGLAAAAAYCWFFPDVYVSRAVLRFIPPQVSERYVHSNESMAAEQRAYALTQTLASSLTARKLIQGAGLYPELRRFWTTVDLVDRFQKDLSVTSGPRSSGPTIPSVAISFKCSDPEKARRVTQQLVEIVYESNRRYKGDESLGTTDFLNNQAESTRAELEELETRLGASSGATGIAGNHQWALKIENLHSLESRLSQVQSSLRTLTRDRFERKEELADAEARLRRVPIAISADTLAPSVELIRIREDYHQVSVTVMQLRDRYRPGHPDLAAAELTLSKLTHETAEQQEREVDVARNHESRRIKDLIEQLRSSIASLDKSVLARQSEESSLTRRVNEVRSTTYPSPDEDSEYLRLSREYAGLKEFYLTLQRKLEESRVASEMERVGRGEVIEVVEPPSTPVAPESPVRAVKLLAGLSAGLAFGLILTMLLTVSQPVVRASSHLQLWPGATLLAELPAAPPRRRRFLRLSAGSSALLLLALFSQGCSRFESHSKQHYFERANQSAARGQYQAAIIDYRRALRIDQRYAQAHERLSSLLLDLGEAEQAYPSLLRAAELMPSNLAVQLRLVDYTQRVYLGDPARPLPPLREIEDISQRLITAWPAQPEGYRYLAFVLVERHRPDEAVSLLRSSLQKTDANPSLVCDLATIYHRQKQYDQARLLLDGLIAAKSSYEPAYDLLYLQLMESRQVREAGDVLLAKRQACRSLEAALQYAAHLHSNSSQPQAAALLDQLAASNPNSPDLLARIGDFWLNRGDQTRAKSSYQRGLDSHPQNRTLYLGRLVELSVAAKRKDEARALLDAELRNSPKNDVLSAYRAALDIDSSESAAQAKARLELESILLRMPRSAFVRYHLGRAYLRVGDTIRAEQHLERCVRLDPNYAPGWLALAEADFAHGKLLRAQQRVSGLLARAPSHSGGLLLQARLLQSQGKLDLAAQGLVAAARAGADPQELALERANLHLQRGKPADALKLLKTEWTGPASDERFILATARSEFAAGQIQAALARLQAAIAASPEPSRLRKSYAQLLAAAGDLPAALAQYSELRKANPAPGAFSLEIADLLALTGKLPEASAEYRAAQKAQPQNPTVWLHSAPVLAAAGDSAAAQDAYTRALALDTANPVAMNNLAYLLARSGNNLDYALQLAQDAAQALPQNQQILDTLAYVQLRSGLKQPALSGIERLIRSAGPHNKAALEAARLHARRGELLLAARRLEEARDRSSATPGGARL